MAAGAAASGPGAATVRPVMPDPTDPSDPSPDPTAPADDVTPTDRPTPAPSAGDRRSRAGEPDPDEFSGGFERVTASRRWPVAVVGLLAVVALLASMLLVRRASSGDGGGGDGGDGDATTATTAEPEPATEAEIEAAVAEISDFVAEEAGMPFLEPVTVELEGEGDFQDRLLEDFDDDAEELRQTEVFLTGLGLVDPGVDMVESMRSLLGGGVVGFYDPESDELVVRGAALTPYVRTTIAHELTHALDDQHHDLDRPEYDEADDETSFGFSAVVEGNARRIESAYHATLDEDERRQATEEELALGGDVDIESIPLILVDLIGAPYTLGEPFVDAVLAELEEPVVDYVRLNMLARRAS